MATDTTHIVDAEIDTDVLTPPEPETEPTREGDAIPENPCVHFPQCGNEVHANNEMCGECLDRVRYRDSDYHIQ